MNKENNTNINFTSIVDYIRDKDNEIEYLKYKLNKLNKQKEVLDKIKEYVEENKIIGVIAREENEYMTHILKLLEEIE